MRGRRIAFDYGDSRIGVAICDPDGILATPLPFLDARHPKLMAQIGTLIDEYQPIRVYVGEPKMLSGNTSTAVEKAEKFADALSKEFSLEIVMIDERLSTVDAARKLRESGISARESKTLIDSMAAVAILENGLAHEGK
jgi:putative Holliday junction resolvase